MTLGGDVTQLLLSLQAGDQSVVEKLTPILYEELRRLAKALFRRERPDHTMQPTALVNEAYMRLIDQKQAGYQTRAHFIGIAARVMRQILVDHSRARVAEKRGGGEPKITLQEDVIAGTGMAAGVLALHDALDDLAALDARKAQIIEMRFFGGLTGDEIAEALGVGTATVSRDLRMAQAWLAQRLQT